jgi:hypothetical protein
MPVQTSREVPAPAPVTATKQRPSLTSLTRAWTPVKKPRQALPQTQQAWEEQPVVPVRAAGWTSQEVPVQTSREVPAPTSVTAMKQRPSLTSAETKVERKGVRMRMKLLPGRLLA